MSFLLRCPHCGDRSAYEFRFGGEVKQRPSPGAPDEEWVHYIYTRANEAGVQKEWWYHRNGCRQWMWAVRNTVTNQVLETMFPEEPS
jgi:heterotetrameric sarcosine oxidase delta subunit